MCRARKLKRAKFKTLHWFSLDCSRLISEEKDIGTISTRFLYSLYLHWCCSWLIGVDDHEFKVSDSNELMIFSTSSQEEKKVLCLKVHAFTVSVSLLENTEAKRMLSRNGVSNYKQLLEYQRSCDMKKKFWHQVQLPIRLYWLFSHTHTHTHTHVLTHTHTETERGRERGREIENAMVLWKHLSFHTGWEEKVV